MNTAPSHLFALLAAIVSLHHTLISSAHTATLDFEPLSGMANRPVDLVAPDSRLSDQFLASHGVRFRSGPNVPYVAVVNAGPLPSGTNGIGGVNRSFHLDYAAPVEIAFFDPR